MVHYSGDTDVEEPFEMDEDDKVVSQDEETVIVHEEKKKKKQKQVQFKRRNLISNLHLMKKRKDC